MANPLRKFVRKKTRRTSSSGSFDEFDGIEAPCISQIFADAALYRQVINHPEETTFCHASDTQAVQDFAELVGRDLSSPEKALAGRFAQLSVESEDVPWLPDDDKLTEEPEPISEESSSQGTTSDAGADSSDKDDSSSSEVETDDSVALSPQEIVSLLREEFGDLAPESEEKLLFEADAALVLDVILLGVIHITTHRFAFHASIPASARPGILANSVIKAGPAVIHRKGLHRKRRVWLELSHDFVSTFPSSGEHDRIRPLKSILLSSIKGICPEDPAQPQVIHFSLYPQGGNAKREALLEFDTVESAREWRREFQGAIFFYRRSLKATLQNAPQDDEDGSVRIVIPLTCIARQVHKPYANKLNLVSLFVKCPNPLIQDHASSSQYSGSNSSAAPDLQLVQFAMLENIGSWTEMARIIDRTQARVDPEDPYAQARHVVVDYGSLGYHAVQRIYGGGDTEKNHEQFVCDILGITHTPDVWVVKGRLQHSVICSGYLVVSPKWVGFWSKSLTLGDQRYRIPSSTVLGAIPIEPRIRCGFPVYTFQLDIQGHASLRFQLYSERNRDEAIKRVKLFMGANSLSSPPSTPTRSSKSETSSTVKRSSSVLAPISRALDKRIHSNLSLSTEIILQLPKAVNLPKDALYPMQPMHFVCLTIGSRGDVQPYIALALGLKSEGHSVTIVTHPEYKSWIESFGVEHRAAGGDPGMLMKLSVENKMFSPQFFKESIANYRSWLDRLLVECWEQCRDAEVLLESPYAMAGVHIAEALNIPYFRVCTMPWTKTTSFPHPFISPPVETPRFNIISYVLFDNVLWAATSTQVNRWRRDHLRIGSTDMSHLSQSKIPIVYNFSPSVVPKPLDWNDTTMTSGYWFLDNPDVDWTPPVSLLKWMKKARDDKKPIVYIGFGSITVPNPRLVTEKIVQAVLKSGVRAIMSKGWSSRMSKEPESDVEIPEECYVIDKVPHDWLFPQIDAALHHGGAGTTSASLRAGIPTLIKPWFGDQFFWASRVHALGAGMRVPSLRVNDLAHALTRATTDRIMKEKASLVGEKIRAEDGVFEAIRFIYVYMPRAVRSAAQHLTP